MTKLETILAPYKVLGELGDRGDFDREYLRNALSAASRQSAVAFWAAVGAQLGVFLLAAWFAVENAANPKVLSLVLAGGGGGVGACGFAMVRLWKDKVATDLTLALVSSLDAPVAKTVLNIVLDTFRRGGNSGRGVQNQRANAQP
jgi:hypothetical protein